MSSACFWYQNFLVFRISFVFLFTFLPYILKQLVNQFNNMSSQPDDINSDDPENTVSSKYYDIDELQNLKINNSNSLSLFHVNACSLSRNFDDLQHLLSCTNKIFDIIAITETRIKQNVSIKNI